VDNNSIKSDLHLHTTASDGRLSPAQLVELAVKKGLDVIAVTDHDTVEGLRMALDTAKKLQSICVIPGVEINTDVPGAEVHMLGYFIDFDDGDFLEALSSLRNARETRAVQMLSKLDKLGMHISWEKLKGLSKDSSIGRPHVAQALVEAGYVLSFQEAFEKFIGRGKPAYVEHKKMTPVEVVKLITEARGVPVLAHPDSIPGLAKMLKALKEQGLMGLETYYGSYSHEVIHKLLKLAKLNSLVPTGGTDYHAFNDSKETMIGGTQPPPEYLRELFKLGSMRNPWLFEKYGIPKQI
jgi:3',5'-nucleoside bisphosphate phosphatase